MNIVSVSVRNIRVRLLSSGLTLLSVALGAALVAALWLMIEQTEQRYQQSMLGYKAVVGPKEGSPLALVLSTVLNLGYEPGVVPMSVYHELHDGPLGRRIGVRYAIPQARGDSYAGFPLIGTTDEMFGKFARGNDENDVPRTLQLSAGETWTYSHDEFVVFAEELAAKLANGETIGTVHEDHWHPPAMPSAWRRAVIGSEVSRATGLEVGSTFIPVHGRTDEVGSHEHIEAKTKVVGVLARTGTPLDRSIFVPISLFLSMGGHEAIRPDAADPEAGNILLSAIIVDTVHHLGGNRLRYEFQTRPEAQVAWPQAEILNLLKIIGNAADALRVVAWLVVIVASIGVLVALYNTMNERRREIAIMRALGARRWQILAIILSEATLIALGGGVLGVFLCHAAAFALADVVADQTSVAMDWASFSIDEVWLILGVAGLGGFAGVLPAVKGSWTEVAENIGPVS